MFDDSSDFTQLNINGLVLMTAPGIDTPHAFTTRLGGVSGGIYASLNLGENRGDGPENVAENFRRLRAALGIGRLAFTRQVHGSLVRAVTSADAREPGDPPAPEADGLVTAEPGLGLIVFIADCIPILFHDPVGRVIGAAHAGWRGTVADIAGETVRKMAELGSNPADIHAAIGPGIGACCFETGPEVPEAVTAALGPAGAEFIDDGRAPGKFHVDLKGVNRALLIRAGLEPENIDVSQECTMCRPFKYWSHRYTKGQRGSQAAVIVLTGKGAAL